MRTRSRIHRNRSIDPLFSRRGRSRTQTKRKRNPLSAVARRQSIRPGVKALLPVSRPATQATLAAPPKHILVPIDFSKESTRAVKFAVELASRYAAAVTLIHIVESIYYIRDFGYGPVRRRRPNEALMRHARQRLRALRRRHVESALTCKVLIKSGNAFEQITKAAEELDADLIVMPTRGSTSHQSGEIGSTAERVVRHAPCPVLTVRKPVLLRKRPKS